MDKQHDSKTRLDEALILLGYTVTEGSAEGVFKVSKPDGTDAGEFTSSDCWAYLRERHRELFEASPPIWDENCYGPFWLTFSGFCPAYGHGIFNGRHECPEK